MPAAVTPPAGCQGSDGHAAFVLAAAKLQPVPFVPELMLYLAGDAYRLWEQTERHTAEPDLPPPFWAFAWPGGQALARYVLDNPALVAGRTVLDLGSGSGLTAIAAALAGAARVLASEIDPIAAAAIALNARANGASITVTGDVLDGDGEGAGLVLAADVWYDKRLAERAHGLLGRACARGARALAGDVGRAFLPRELLRELAAYQVPVVADLEDAPLKRAMVLELSAREVPRHQREAQAR